MFKKIKWLFLKQLTWNPLPDEDGKYITSKYPETECWLEINDFPDEPLWTLHFKGEKVDIEDTPILWKVNYRSK